MEGWLQIVDDVLKFSSTHSESIRNAQETKRQTNQELP